MCTHLGTMSTEKPQVAELTQQPQQSALVAGATPTTKERGGKQDVTVSVGNKEDVKDIDAQLAHVGGGLASQSTSRSPLTQQFLFSFLNMNERS